MPELTDLYADFTLLVNGENAFPAIIAAMESARRSIRINMFIWRDDKIGNRMAKAVLRAAERGVTVSISIDRYGVVLEKSEECKKSFFHKKQSLTEKLKTRVLEVMYPMPGAPRRARDVRTPLYERIMHHPNITVSADVFKADHSKFYVIDDEVLFLGGINIEDKENGRDLQGREYGDYMARLTGKQYVEAFLAKLWRGEDLSADYRFGVNTKAPLPHRFEMEGLYLDLIRSARSELHITMAYFSAIKPFVDAIVAAQQRGVRVTVMVPARANYQADTDLRTVKKILKATNNGITVYLSPKMLHTKLVANEDTVSFGSTNITKKAFRQLSELNLFLRNTDCDFRNALFADLQKNYAEAKRVTDWREIKYNRLRAALESVLV